MSPAAGSGRRLVVEADGGSRGNPGPAGYGALVKDGGPKGPVVAEVAKAIGRATNNVAEYGGLLAGLRAAKEIDPGASVLVRMDSKLVVEQMSGRWKVKHADMQRLWQEAREVWPREQVRFEWIPRAQNSHADRLANEAMDAAAAGRSWEPKNIASGVATTGAASGDGGGDDWLLDLSGTVADAPPARATQDVVAAHEDEQHEDEQHEDQQHEDQQHEDQQHEDQQPESSRGRAPGDATTAADLEEDVMEASTATPTGGQPSSQPAAPSSGTAATERKSYKLLTGPDTPDFCQKVSDHLDQGYVLHGETLMVFDGTELRCAQAVVLPEDQR